MSGEARHRRSIGPPVELTVTALAAGGDGVARDEGGRVTFVPRAAPGDRVRGAGDASRPSRSRARELRRGDRSPRPIASSRRARTSSTAAVAASGSTSRAPTQLAAKQAIVAGALRKVVGLIVHDIADPAPPLGWRRRARFHVAGGKVGLFALGSHRVIAIDHCPQLEARLDAALGQVAASVAARWRARARRSGTRADVAVGVGKPWQGGRAPRRQGGDPRRDRGRCHATATRSSRSSPACGADRGTSRRRAPPATRR